MIKIFDIVENDVFTSFLLDYDFSNAGFGFLSTNRNGKRFAFGEESEKCKRNLVDVQFCGVGNPHADRE